MERPWHVRFNLVLFRAIYYCGMVSFVAVMTMFSIVANEQNYLTFQRSLAGQAFAFSVGLLVLYSFWNILYAFVHIIRNRDTPRWWIVILIFLPVLGPYIYYERHIFGRVYDPKKTFSTKIDPNSFTAFSDIPNLMIRRIFAAVIDHGILLSFTTIYVVELGEWQGGKWVITDFRLLIPLFTLWAMLLPLPEAFIGMTLGKRILRLRVVDEGGNRVRLHKSFLRHLLDLPDIAFVTFTFIVTTRTIVPRRLGDIISGTWVLTDESLAALRLAYDLRVNPGSKRLPLDVNRETGDKQEK